MPEEIKELDVDMVDFKLITQKINEIVRALNAYEITARIPGAVDEMQRAPLTGELLRRVS